MVITQLRTQFIDKGVTILAKKQKDHIDLFTDGGSTRIPSNSKIYYGASCYIIRYKDKYFTSVDVMDTTSSSPLHNKCELRALRNGLEALTKKIVFTEDLELRICMDSEYAINCVSLWIKNWVRMGNTLYRRDGSEIANSKLILEVVDLLSKIPKYRFLKIESHIEPDGNALRDSYETFKVKNKMPKLELYQYYEMVFMNDRCDKLIQNEYNKIRVRMVKNHSGGVV